MNSEEKFCSKEFFVTKVVDQIFATKKRMDRLLFLLILVSAIGIIYPNNPPSSFSFIINKLTPFYYHLGIVLSLLGIFTMIGSVLIDYIVKRKKIDNFFMNDPFVLEHYKTEYIIFQDESKEESVRKNKLYYISRTIVPSSFYEFLYTLHITKKHLRLISAIVLMIIFMISHVVCCLHVLQITNGWSQYVGISIIFMINLVLYGGVINSVKKYHQELWSTILWISIICAIPAILILLNFIMSK